MNPKGATHGNLLSDLRGFFASLVEHLHLLVTLATVEAREALTIYLLVGIALVVALVCAFFAYILLVLFIAFGVAALFRVDWIWITLGLALLHLAGTAGGVVFAMKKWKIPVFVHTSEEIRADIKALRPSQRP